MNTSKTLLRFTFVTLLIGLLSGCGDPSAKSAEGENGHGHSHE
ncbi:hypothetical protein [Pseudomonas sp. LS-2]|jgi:hypothetical protein|nr:hypothetical protein [Pseudomonas sp. LS-2]